MPRRPKTMSEKAILARQERRAKTRPHNIVADLKATPADPAQSDQWVYELKGRESQCWALYVKAYEEGKVSDARRILQLQVELRRKRELAERCRLMANYSIDQQLVELRKLSMEAGDLRAAVELTKELRALREADHGDSPGIREALANAERVLSNLYRDPLSPARAARSPDVDQARREVAEDVEVWSDGE